MKRNISGRRIREARLNAKMDQTDLAAALEVEHDLVLQQSDISEIETRVRGVKDYELKALAQVLNVTLEWLVSDDEE